MTGRVDFTQDLNRLTAEENILMRAILELTYRCNLRCLHCYCVETGQREELTTREWMHALEELAGLGVYSITFTGGEVHLRPDYWELFQHARQLRFAVRVFTNGTLIREPEADRYQELQPTSVEVSLYGASAATYQRITGNGEQLERVVEALRLLRDRGLLVVAKVPVLQENVGELPAIEALCADLGVTASTSAAITMRDDGDRGPLEHRLEQGQLARHLARRHGPPPPGPPPGADAHVCFTGKNALVVTPHGDVHPCVQLKRSCGNLRRSTLQAIWDEAPLLHHLRQLRLCDWTGCPACEHLAYCRPCPGLSWFEHGVLTRPSTCDCRQARALGPPGVSGEGGTGPGTPGCQGLAPGT